MGMVANDWLSTVRPACLNSLTIPPDLRVAVLAPHPDDFDAAGVTLRMFQGNGNPMTLAVLTIGVEGRWPSSGWLKTRTGSGHGRTA